jgi:LmbE family N-acetylglucosaminyl deacetylase
MRAFGLVVFGVMLCAPCLASSQGPAPGVAPKTLVAVLAHADDEAPVAPILARYAREGVRVYLLIASDGSQGFGSRGNIQRGDSTVRGDTLAVVRAEEARCAAQALGVNPPIQLGFPDGKLGDYIGDRSLLFRLTQRMAVELERLRPDAILTWGPDGGIGHPDHRIVSGIVMQLARAGAPGVPERIFHMYLPAEAIRAMNPQRGEPPLMIPQAKYFTVRVPFTPADLEAALRSMACHKSQMAPEAMQRIIASQGRVLNGNVALVPAFSITSDTDVFR